MRPATPASLFVGSRLEPGTTVGTGASDDVGDAAIDAATVGAGVAVAASVGPGVSTGIGVAAGVATTGAVALGVAAGVTDAQPMRPVAASTRPAAIRDL